jgi:hypothetical protein
LEEAAQRQQAAQGRSGGERPHATTACPAPLPPISCNCQAHRPVNTAEAKAVISAWRGRC